jgi:hypothetical protein
MSAVQLNILQAIEQRDKGIERAVNHAESVHPGWKEDAFQMFKEWLSGWPSGYKFTIEHFRQVAQIKGLPDPPSNRAFGSLALRARIAGLITSNETVKVQNKKAHRANAALWRKV